jgi:hypothetical protein
MPHNEPVQVDAFGAELATINSLTLHMLRDHPDLFDDAARRALFAVTSAVAAIQGPDALRDMLDTVCAGETHPVSHA